MSTHHSAYHTGLSSIQWSGGISPTTLHIRICKIYQLYVQYITYYYCYYIEIYFYVSVILYIVYTFPYLFSLFFFQNYFLVKY